MNHEMGLENAQNSIDGMLLRQSSNVYTIVNSRSYLAVQFLLLSYVSISTS